MSGGRTRRRLLTGLGSAAGLGGCLRLAEEDGRPTRDRSGTAASTPKDRATEGQTPNATAIDGDYPEYGADPANTGYRPDVSGPTDRLEIAWSGPDAGLSVPVVDGGDVYVGGKDGRVYALRTGTVRWSAPLGADEHAQASPVCADDRVIVPGLDGYVRAYGRDGTEQWVSPRLYPEGAEFDPVIVTQPTVVSDLVVTGGANGSVNVLDLASGGLLWQRHVGGSGIVPAVDEDRVYAAAGAPQHEQTDGLRAFALRDGAEQWRAGSDERFNSNPPAVSGDRVFVASRSGTLYAHDAADGSEAWRHHLEGTIFGTAPAVHDGTVYLGDTSGAFHAVDASTGDVRWTYAFANGINGPAVVTDEAVFAVDNGGDVRALAPTDGTPLAVKQASGGAFGLAVLEDALVVSGRNGGVQVLRER